MWVQTPIESKKNATGGGPGALPPLPPLPPLVVAPLPPLPPVPPLGVPPLALPPLLEPPVFLPPLPAWPPVLAWLVASSSPQPARARPSTAKTSRARRIATVRSVPQRSPHSNRRAAHS